MLRDSCSHVVVMQVMLYQSYSPEHDLPARGLAAGDIVWLTIPGLGLFLQTAPSSEQFDDINILKSEVIEAVPGGGSGRVCSLDGMFELEFAKPIEGGAIRLSAALVCRVVMQDCL